MARWGRRRKKNNAHGAHKGAGKVRHTHEKFAPKVTAQGKEWQVPLAQDWLKRN